MALTQTNKSYSHTVYNYTTCLSLGALQMTTCPFIYLKHCVQTPWEILNKLFCLREKLVCVIWFNCLVKLLNKIFLKNKNKNKTQNIFHFLLIRSPDSGPNPDIILCMMKKLYPHASKNVEKTLRQINSMLCEKTCLRNFHVSLIFVSWDLFKFLIIQVLMIFL